MWSKLSLRIKITTLTALTLTIMCTGLTFISILNTEVFYKPIAYVLDKKTIDKGVTPNGGDINHIDGAQDIQIVDEIFIGSRNQFKILSILTSICIVFVGTFLSYIIVGKSLKSLSTFTNKIMEIDENNLNGQILLPASRDEISKLTQAFNHMLLKLDRAFESKKLFSANVAHELKTPLTTILTNIEVMQLDEEPKTDDCKEVIEITKDNIERLTALVEDLLYFNSELDDENFENIDTKQLFEKILDDLSSYIRDKNIIVITQGSIVIRGDRNLLERAFYNIIQNSIKYNKEYGEIIITAREGTVTIEDTGVGIPDESIPQIFDPFYCVDKSRSRSLGGSGLGLSITKQIFDKHNMKITVSSQLKKGSKFFITI